MRSVASSRMRDFYELVVDRQDPAIVIQYFVDYNAKAAVYSAMVGLSSAFLSIYEAIPYKEQDYDLGCYVRPGFFL